MFEKKAQIYPKELESCIRFNTKYIPRLIDHREYLVLFKRYWIKEVNGIYKLTKIEEYFRNYYYYLEGKDSSQLYTYPLDDNMFYEMVVNTDDILTQNIINNDTEYKGYEIKYWFYKKWNKKYKDYEKFLSVDSPNKIDDNKDYKVYGIIIKGRYQNCKMILS